MGGPPGDCARRHVHPERACVPDRRAASLGRPAPSTLARARRSHTELQDKVTAGWVVHIGMMFFIPLFAAVVYLLLRGVEGTAPRSAGSRVPFVVFYSAWEALQGMGVGILVDEVNQLRRPSARRGQIWSTTSPTTFSFAISVCSAASSVRLDHRSDRSGRCPPPPRRHLLRRGPAASPASDHGPPTSVRADWAGSSSSPPCSSAKPTGRANPS